MYIDDIAYYYRVGREGASVVSHNGMKYLLTEFLLNDRLLDKNEIIWQKAINARLMKMICVRLHLMAKGEYWLDAEEEMQELKEKLAIAEKKGFLDFDQLVGGKEEIDLAKAFLESPLKAYELLRAPIAENIKRATDFIEKLDGTRIVIVTAGRRAAFLKKVLDQTERTEVVAVCDNSETRQGDVLGGLKIISAHKAVEQFGDACFVVATQNDTESLKRQLIQENIASDRILLFDIPCVEDFF